jgi:hypothetical protein
MATITLSGLPGTRGKVIDAVRFDRVESAARLLVWARGIAAIGRLGSLTVYRDDDDRLRAERNHFHRVETSAEFDSIDEAVAWLRVNLPLIGKEAV